MEHLDNCVVQMQACSDKVRNAKVALSAAYLDMKTRDLPSIITKSKLVLEVEETEEELMAKKRKRFESFVKQAEDHIDKLMSEKSQLEANIRRQSLQFREVLQKRDSDVQVEYNKMLNELNDHLEETKQQLEATIVLRDKKKDELRNLPSPSLATQSDLHTNHTLQQQVVQKTNEIADLQAQFRALEDEIASTNPLKRKADAIDDAASKERDVVACKELQNEIELLQETEANLRDEANNRRLIGIQREENLKMKAEIDDVQVDNEIANVKTTFQQLSNRFQSQFRALASISSSGAILTKLYSLVSSRDGPLSLTEFLQLCPNHEEGMEAVELFVKVGVVAFNDITMEIRKV